MRTALPPTDEEVRELHARGQTTRQIAAALELPPSTVADRLRRLELEPHRRPRAEPRTTGELSVRWSRLEADLVRRASRTAGVDASDAVRTAALAWAREVLGSTDPPG